MKTEKNILSDIEESDINSDGIFIVPKEVHTLSKFCFYRCKTLKEITLPSSLTSIEDGVFRECSSLKNIINCSKNLSSFNQHAFVYCSSLVSINDLKVIYVSGLSMVVTEYKYKVENLEIQKGFFIHQINSSDKEVFYIASIDDKYYDYAENLDSAISRVKFKKKFLEHKK